MPTLQFHRRAQDALVEGHFRTERVALPTPSLLSPLELCQRLEKRGIPTWSQGEGLLDDLRAGMTGDLANPITRANNSRTRCLLCAAESGDLLSVLPRAVVTASQARRLSVATTEGPVDLFPIGEHSLEETLIHFGLGPFAIAFRPTEAHWCDPSSARQKFEDGILDLPTQTSNPFLIAPQRFWICARVLSQYALEPSVELLEAARVALPKILKRLPRGAPARRELSRVLTSANPENGLAFLHQAGVSQALFSGIKPCGAARVALVAPDEALRWAVWLYGAALGRALVVLRMPHTLARRIERLRRAHPIDRTIQSLREASARKVLHKLDEAEISGLIEWRRLELASAPQNEETQARVRRLDKVEERLTEIRQHRARSSQVRQLALDGQTVMSVLDAGPGRRVGLALAHLASWVDHDPSVNEPEALIRELKDWAAKNPSS